MQSLAQCKSHLNTSKRATSFCLKISSEGKFSTSYGKPVPLADHPSTVSSDFYLKPLSSVSGPMFGAMDNMSTLFSGYFIKDLKTAIVSSLAKESQLPIG